MITAGRTSCTPEFLALFRLSINLQWEVASARGPGRARTKSLTVSETRDAGASPGQDIHPHVNEY
jgi:hypothetical protein